MMTNDDYDGDTEIISEGPTSIVARIESKLPGGPRFIAAKTSSTTNAKEPHDIIKEVRLLVSLSHVNIIPLINQQLSQRSQLLGFWMPYIPYSLDELLQSFRFSPHPVISFGNATSSSPTPREVQFVILAKSILFQVFRGVSYLHSEHIRIAHRDIKPGNVLLTASGRAQLIDFGIAFRVGEDSAAKARDLWPEPTTRMYFEVSTGQYRAPELLFGPRTYDAFAIDAWSLGVIVSEFFTSLCLQTDEDEDDEGPSLLRFESASESGSEASAGPRAPTPPPAPFIIPRGAGPRSGIPTGRWARTSLFDATRGEIGLAWSIFRVRGTPNEDTWPSFLALPDAGKLSFVKVNAVELSPFLPNLPPSTLSIILDTRTHTPALDPAPSPLDLIHRFLVYEPSRRLRPSEALLHPWFRVEPGLVLPADDDRTVQDPPWLAETEVVAHTFTLQGQTCTLGDLLQGHVTSKG